MAIDQRVNTRPTLNPRDVRRRFDRAAASFDSADFVHAITRDGLLARLEPLVFDAENILDLGSATCSAEQSLRKRFAHARIISLDVSHSMLRQGRSKRSWFSRASRVRSSYVQADASRLPFADDSMDLVFSNQLPSCIGDPGPVFEEVARVLREGGVFAFAALGPDSLLELSRAWSEVDNCAHVNRFLDMHDIGDAVVRARLRDPVLDVDRLTVIYESPGKLFADLTSVGARNALTQRNTSLIGRQRFEKMLAALKGNSDNGKITLELELVYGHCWGSGPRTDSSNYRIDPSDIPRRRK
jgi:malonyl-CoA O-methyltransferase